MNEDTESLLPCPFCGEEAVISTNYESAYWAECTNCKACSKLFYALMDDVTSLVVESWNKRKENA